MKVFIVLAACIVAVSAGRSHYGTSPLAAVSTGTSSQFRQDDNYGNYNFGYDESHASGATSRREEQTNGVRRGSYSLSDADGRQRIVNYIADHNGFRASIQSNEPGIEPKDSADVSFNRAGPVAAVAAPAPAPIAGPGPISQGYEHPTVYEAVRAPLPVPAPLPTPTFETHAPALAAPVAPLPVAAPSRGYYTQRAAPLPVAAAPVAIEAETPRAFSYSFGSTHLSSAAPAHAAPVHAAPVHAAPVHAAPVHTAPVHAVPSPARSFPAFQQRLEY